MKIAITGGAGFVGSHLARAYLDAGHDVLVIDSFVSGSRQAIDPRARLYPVDIRDSKLQTILQCERPDLLSHHAAQHQHMVFGEHSLTDADIHIRGLLNVLDGCVNASVGKIIFASGGNTLYGRIACAEEGQAALPIVEEDTLLCPQRPYDISKVAGESYVRYYTLHYGLQHTILRYADIYGEPGREQAQHPLSYFIAMLSENRRPVIRGSGKEVRDHIFIDDVVRANLYALERGKNGTMHISSGQGCDLNQLYCAAAQLLRSDLLPVYISGSLAGPPAIALDNSRARRLLGWHPEISFTEGVQRAVDRLCGPVVPVAVAEQAEQALPRAERTGDRSAALVLV